MMVLRVLDIELYEKTMRLGQALVPGVSVYPFFRETGEVVYLMVVLPHESRVFMLPYTKRIVNTYFWSAMRLDITLDQLKVMGNFQGKDIEGLFHYDTRWVLSEDRFKNYWARDLIKQTNCAEKIRKQVQKEIQHLRFSRDLSTLESLRLKPRSLAVTSSVRADKVLKTLAEPGDLSEGQGLEEQNRQWVLDPVWQDLKIPKPDEWR